MKVLFAPSPGGLNNSIHQRLQQGSIHDLLKNALKYHFARAKKQYFLCAERPH